MRFTTDVAGTVPTRHGDVDSLDLLVDLLVHEGHRHVSFDADLDFVVAVSPSREVGHYPSIPRFAVTVTTSGPSQCFHEIPGQRPHSYSLRGTPAPEGWREQVEFALREFLASLDGEPSVTDARDTGASLLRPISRQEHAAIEGLLAILWQAAADDRLTDTQERMILSIAQMIEQQHRATVPEDTERWMLVGAVSSGLRFLLNELPDGVVKWGAAGVILTNIDWTELAQALPG